MQLKCQASFDDVPGSSARPQTLTLIIGKHNVRNYSLTGRATKGYFAYVVGQKRLVFLKLSWRPNSPNIPAEHVTYQMLYDAEVPNIPQLAAGEDACHRSGEKLRTRTQEFMTGDKPLERLQYRLVVETLGLPLSEYVDSYALVCVIRDAVAGASYVLYII